eukprot:5176461-Alexandrium_andersonii.AAC.1
MRRQWHTYCNSVGKRVCDPLGHARTRLRPRLLAQALRREPSNHTGLIQRRTNLGDRAGPSCTTAGP